MRQTGKITINKLPKPSKPQALIVKNHTPSKCQILEFILVSLNRLLIGFVAIYMCWMCLRLNYRDIPFHAVFCTLGVSEFV